VLWLEALHHCDVLLKCSQSSLNTETPGLEFAFRRSEGKPHDDSIVGMLIYDPSLHFLEVQSLHLRNCQAEGCGQRSGSGDA